MTKHLRYDDSSACHKCYDLRRLTDAPEDVTCKLCIKWMGR